MRQVASLKREAKIAAIPSWMRMLCVCDLHYKTGTLAKDSATQSRSRGRCDGSTVQLREEALQRALEVAAMYYIGQRPLHEMPYSPVREARLPMLENQPPYFLHRQPTQDIFESVCLRCFLTIASANDVSSFRTEELEHVCDKAIIARREEFKRVRVN